MSSRLRSLDAFRGFTIAAMILVNNPGSWSHVFPALLHAPWHGWTLTDLIFPFFLFIVGVAIPFSTEKRMDRGASRPRLLAQMLRRSAILIGLGLFLAAFPFFDLGSLRLPGVLQRIGVVYWIVGAATLWFTRRGLRWLAAICLVGFHAVMRFVPAPGGVAGDLEPETSIAAWLDRALLGANLYQGTWDPEGVLSTVPAIATAVIGALAGKWLYEDWRTDEGKAGRLAVAGFALLSAGWAWSFWLPINKNLWTSSYVLFTGGIALSCLALFMLLMDRADKPPPPWTRPLEALGRNAIIVFVGSGLLAKTLLLFPGPGEASAHAWIYSGLFAPALGPLLGSLAFALGHVALWTGVAVILDRRRIYLKV